MAIDSQSQTTSLVARAKAIILSPNTEWPKIATEDTSTRDVFMGYVVPLALIAPIAGLIGGYFLGYGFLGMTVKLSLTSALVMALVSFMLALFNLIIMGLVVDWLSPKFGGELSNERASKLVAYAATPSLVAGIAALSPMLAIPGILLSLYSIYLSYIGVTPMLKVPREKALAFTVVVLLCTLVLHLVIGGLNELNKGLLRDMGLIEQPAAVTMTLPDGTTINSADIEKMAKDLEEATKKQ